MHTQNIELAMRARMGALHAPAGTCTGNVLPFPARPLHLGGNASFDKAVIHTSLFLILSLCPGYRLHYSPSISSSSMSCDSHRSESDRRGCFSMKPTSREYCSPAKEPRSRLGCFTVFHWYQEAGNFLFYVYFIFIFLAFITLL